MLKNSDSLLTRYRPYLRSKSVVLIIFLVGLLTLHSLTSSSPDGSSVLGSRSRLALNSQGLSKEHVNTDVILYVYFETDEAARNFQFFLSHALHDAADFYIIVNGDCSIDIPEKPNVHVIRRDNTCFDLGAAGEVLKANEGALQKRYSRFIIMNASVRGPFIPGYVQGESACWSSNFFNHLSDRVKQVGLTANCDPTFPKHLQSMVIAFDKVGLDIVMPALVCFPTITDTILRGEVTLTPRILERGYEAKPLYTFANVLRLKEGNRQFWETCNHLDVFYANAMDGVDLNPFDTMFVKTSRAKIWFRNILSESGHRTLHQMTLWMDGSNFSSYDHCRHD